MDGPALVGANTPRPLPSAMWDHTPVSSLEIRILTAYVCQGTGDSCPSDCVLEITFLPVPPSHNPGEAGREASVKNGNPKGPAPPC